MKRAKTTKAPQIKPELKYWIVESQRLDREIREIDNLQDTLQRLDLHLLKRDQDKLDALRRRKSDILREMCREYR